MSIVHILKYYQHNFKRFLPVFAAISFSILLVYTVQMIVNSMISSNYNMMVEPSSYLAQIRAKFNPLDDKILDLIESRAETERVIRRCGCWGVEYSLLLGGAEAADLYKVSDDDRDYLMSLLKMKIKEGRKPATGEKAILLHYLVAANLNLKVGEYFKINLRGITNNYKIVGLLDGKPLISFGPYENDDPWTAVIVPRKGFRQKLFAYLEALPKNHNFVTYNSKKFEFDVKTRGIRVIINVINIMLMIIVATCMGYLYHVYLYHRRTEFGILLAIGYTRYQVTKSMIMEIFLSNFLGLLLGGGLSILLGKLLQTFVFLPKGQVLNLIIPDYIIRSLCVVAAASVFSVIPAWKMMGKIDPVIIIENGV